jgi:predicted aspartyl protease
MSFVHAEITLKNAVDVDNARNGRISVAEVRQVTADAIVGTGAWSLVINEETREKLGLKTESTKEVTLADGSRATYDLTEPVRVYWKDRDIVCQALVLPNADKILLGAFPRWI